jgi:16S rRNA processing protein RimM
MHEQPTPENTLLVGILSAPFGVRGQIKMRAITSNLEHLIRKIRTVYVGPSYQTYRITNMFEHKPGLLILTLDGVADRNAAEALRGADVSILSSHASPLADDEYFLHDLPGLRVETESGALVGVVRDYIETGANEVIVVAREGAADALIPLVHDIVVELNIAAKRIVIRPLPGLLDNEAAAS